MLTEEALRGASMEVQKFLVESVPEGETPHQFSEKFEKKMKRVILWSRVKRWIPAILVLVMAVSIFIYCKATDDNVLWYVPLSDEAKEQLDNAFLLQSNDSFCWESPVAYGDPYYGSINGCMILKTDQVAVGMEIGRIEIADHIFYWDGPFRLYAYREGEFCLLEEAYERGWLTEEHIEKIYREHQERIALWTEEKQAAFEDLFEKVEENFQDK